MLPLCHQTLPLCPSNAAIVPIKCCHCAQPMLPLCPSNAATVTPPPARHLPGTYPVSASNHSACHFSQSRDV
ncbi:hypothetical protein AB205_0187730 [Aquarana catesbeiana]|uniref:Uncharacterized protein n=1 Tax=Aquarana catesbeiana TaxID=8400 RepID=A0A2G9SH23_AQUCT|nr:hypothetical protein AB205_0187730 [Aquarana catesbeiana]